MSDTEFTGRYQDAWVSRRFMMPLRQIKKESPLMIFGRRHKYPEQLTISIYVNGTLVHQEVNPAPQFSITVLLPPMIRGTLEIVSSDVFVPREKGLNEDVRKLAFLLDEVVVSGLQDLMEPYRYLFDFNLTKKIYFLDDEIWDEVTFLLPDSYKVPDKGMLEPLQDQEWWESITPPSGSFLRGIAYDKFTGMPVRKAVVQLFNMEKQQIAERSVDERGQYEFANLPHGGYVVAGKSEDHGEQQIAVSLSGYGKTINLPLLPLV